MSTSSESEPLIVDEERSDRHRKSLAHRVSRFFGLEDGSLPLASEIAPLTPRDHRPTWQPNKDTKFFHGKMTVESVEHRMRVHGMEDGLYLVREDFAHNYVLCVSFDAHVLQFLITMGTVVSGRFCIEGGPSFSSLNGLVAYYTLERDGLPVRLRRACPKSNMVRVADLMTSVDDYAEDEVTEIDFDDPSPQRRGSIESKTSAMSSLSVANARQNHNPKGSTPYSQYGSKKVKGHYELVGTPQFKPHFINLMTFLQIVLLAYLCLKGGIESVRFRPKVQNVFVSFGFSLETTEITVTKLGNPFAGPSFAFLIQSGAKYTPCMRKDIEIAAASAKTKSMEQTLFGCCVETFGNGTSAHRSCGVTTSQDCPATFLGESACPSDCDDFRLAPCCTQSNGTCEILTRSHCAALGGVYHSGMTTCSQVSCLEDSCQHSMDEEHPNQWWRFISSLFLHAGVLHIALNLFIQLSVGVDIERKSGWFRTSFMYFISGIGGNIVSGIFAPKIPQVGPSGAIYGLLGINLVDLLHSWPILPSPWISLLSLALKTAFLLAVGTVPWIDNFAHVGGFVFGVLSGIVFLPYVTFGPWDVFRKRCLLIVCLPLIIIAFVVLLVIFYKVQNTSFCEVCERIQCVEYTTGFCNVFSY